MLLSSFNTGQTCSSILNETQMRISEGLAIDSGGFDLNLDRFRSISIIRSFITWSFAGTVNGGLLQVIILRSVQNMSSLITNTHSHIQAKATK